MYNPFNHQYPYYFLKPSMYGTYNVPQFPYLTSLPVQFPYLYTNQYANQNSNQYIPYGNNPNDNMPITLKDYGPNPFVIDIEKAAEQNNNFRMALWTGKHLQVTLMSINVDEDIGLEIHPNLDQFIRIEEGRGIVKMGNEKNNLDFQANVHDGYVIIIPAGKWHNLINTGNRPLKLYSIYAPPQHPFGTVQKTKADAEENH